MTRGKPLALALLAGLALGAAGCDRVRSVLASEPANTREEPARLSDTPRGEDPVPGRGERTVEFPVVPEAVTRSLFPVDVSQFADATVPVLAPAGMTGEQAERFADSFRATPDGYFARIPLTDYDVVVNGTRVFSVAPGVADADMRDITELLVSESETGMSATFNRFGADYSIEFACRGAGGDEGSSCITRAGATEFVERLIPVGGGGQ